MIIVGGDKGQGFAVQVDSARVPDFSPRALAQLLRTIADQVAQDGDQ